MKKLITVCSLLIGNIAIAGGHHCILNGDIEADNYFTFNEYFVQGDMKGDFTVSFVNTNGNIEELECSSGTSFGRVSNCGDRNVTFALDNKSPNDDSKYKCTSGIFKSVEDLLD